MKSRKLAFVLVCLLLLTLVLSACTSSSTVQTDNENSNSSGGKDTIGTSTSDSKDSLEEVTLHFYFFDGKKSKTDYVWEKISKKYKDKLNAKFDVQFIAGTDYKDKMLVKISAGDKWDLNFDADWVSYFQMINRDAYMPLDDLLPVYAPDLYATYQKSGVLEAAKSKGKIVALPWTMVMTQRPFFQWRGDLAEAAGIDVDPSSIKTIEDVDALLYKLKEAYPDRYTIEVSGKDVFCAKYDLIPISHNFVFNAKEWQNNNKITIEHFALTDAYRELAHYGWKWQKDGLIWADVLVDQLDHNQLIDQGKLITKWGTYEYARTKRAWVEEGARWDYSSLYDDKIWANRTPLANCVAIPVTSENPERTLMFLNLLETDKELYDMVHYGILGETYELNGEEAVYPEGMNQANSNYMDWGGRWALWKPQFMRPDSLYHPNFWVEEKEFAESNPNNIVSPLEGFNFNTESVTTQVAQLDQIFSDANRMIDVGLVDNADAAVDKLIKDLNAAGLDDVRQEMQKQINEFLSSK